MHVCPANKSTTLATFDPAHDQWYGAPRDDPGYISFAQALRPDPKVTALGNEGAKQHCVRIVDVVIRCSACKISQVFRIVTRPLTGNTDLGFAWYKVGT